MSQSIGIDITEQSKVSLFAVLAAIPFLIGGIYWLTIIFEQGAEAARVNDRQDKQIERQSDSIDVVKQMLSDINSRTIRIEERLKRKF